MSSHPVTAAAPPALPSHPSQHLSPRLCQPQGHLTQQWPVSPLPPPQLRPQLPRPFSLCEVNTPRPLPQPSVRWWLPWGLLAHLPGSWGPKAFCDPVGGRQGPFAHELPSCPHWRDVAPIKPLPSPCLPAPSCLLPGVQTCQEGSPSPPAPLPRLNIRICSY